MPAAHIRAMLGLALALAVFSGRVLDVTTGEPLAGVTVRVTGPSTATVTSDRTGRFTIRALRPGNYTVTMHSADVPVQRATVRLRANATTTLDLHICSTTLDYHCGESGGSG